MQNYSKKCTSAGWTDDRPARGGAAPGRTDWRSPTDVVGDRFRKDSRLYIAM